MGPNGYYAFLVLYFIAIWGVQVGTLVGVSGLLSLDHNRRLLGQPALGLQTCFREQRRQARTPHLLHVHLLDPRAAEGHEVVFVPLPK